jgi:diketogulonate reductase-like aldo/keto reductase
MMSSNQKGYEPKEIAAPLLFPKQPSILSSALFAPSPRYTHKLEKKKMPPILSISSILTLPNSTIRIPQLGFGVYLSPASVCTKSCLSALEAGYRHIDTAQYYANEAEVGTAIRDSGLPRSEVFVTTKILSAEGSVEKSYEKCVESVKKIDSGKEGYVDLFLIHSPNPGREARRELWLALEKLLEEGRTRAIGVSNFGIAHIEELKSYGKTWPPHVNQIEVRLIS